MRDAITCVGVVLLMIAVWIMVGIYSKCKYEYPGWELAKQANDILERDFHPDLSYSDIYDYTKDRNENA